MTNPVSEVLALGRVPAAIAGDIRAIAEAASLVSAIERTLVAVLSEITLVSGEITRVRSVIEPQEKRVARIEERVRAMDRRTAVMERALLDLTKQIDAATALLPDPGDGKRGPVLKAKDALTGG